MGGNDSRSDLFAASTSRNDCLWGNVPAVDILQLGRNELRSSGDEKTPATAPDPQRNIRIMFAASGDIRDVVKTVVALPEDLGTFEKVQLYINGVNDMVVARNIMLLKLLTAPEAEENIDTGVAVWYSIAVTSHQLLNATGAAPIDALADAAARLS